VSPGIALEPQRNSPERHAYVPQIDALRALAVMSVLIYHLDSRWLPGGFAGVDVFFVISGYVVSASLLRNRDLPLASFGLTFYAKRILRIVPALLACLLVTALITVSFIPRSWLSDANYFTILLAFGGVSNFYLLLNRDDYFSPRVEFNPATHTWSLGVEEQFYVVFPALYFLWLQRRRGEGYRLIGTYVLAAAVLLSLAYSTFVSLRSPLFAYYSLPSRFWELGLGALLFQLHSGGRYLAATTRSCTVLLGVSLLLLFAALAGSDRALFPVPWGLFATLGSVLFIDAVVSPAGAQQPVMRALGSWPLPAIGKISYSLYLWHWPVYVLFRWTTGLDRPSLRVLALGIVLTVSIASYRLLELPVRRSRTLLARPAGQVVIGGIVAVGVCGSAALATMLAHPYISQSVTTNERDWYPGNWPVAQLAGNAGCHSVETRIPFGEGILVQFERTGCSQPAANLFVIGDSHAGALMTLLSKFAAEQNFNVRLYNRAGCAFLMVTSPTQSPPCVAFARAFTRELQRRSQPGDTVMLPSLRLRRLGDQWGLLHAAEPQVDSAQLRERQAGFAEADAWIASIAPLQLKVVFMSPTPIFRAPAFRCADWFNRMNPACRPGLAMDRDFLLARRHAVMEGMTQLARKHTSVEVWDPFDALCAAPTCSAFRDGRPLFIDGDHLSGYGNLVIYDSFRAVVL